ncbi:SMI1/KNR4 family protein [Streptomyces mirabilis]|uniref:SMI1/KNR4 family protein n=1 Tax=Streptomyces mirabilis TaxID=68239 RepID=UPI0021BF3426|nr:SMI1/KNR4 family protein [Streptomyces mirabilis]MCT9104894.1 molybdenum cofactor biosysnthesis protein MoeA [Streptomyces mirabilis]
MSEIEEVQAAWGRIARWLTANAPSTAEALRGPATDEDIASLRDALGFEVPDVLEALLRTNNGSGAKDTTQPLPNGRVVLLKHVDSAIFPFSKVLLGCEEIVATRARLLDMAQEAEGYWQPHLIPVVWDFYGYALDTSGSSGFRVLRYAEVSPNETEPTTSLGELLRSVADGMDRGSWDVQRPQVVNGSLRWREE